MKRTINVKKICVLSLFLFAPIMPEYFTLFGHPFETYLLSLTFLLTLISFVSERKMHIKVDSIGIIVTLYSIIIAATNLIYGKSIIVCLFLIVKYISPVLVTLYHIKSDQDIEKAIDYVLLGSVFVVLMSFIELTGFNVFSVIENADLGGMGTRSQIRMGLIRLEGPFGQAIPYAIYITFISALVQYRLATTKKRTYAVYLVLLWIAELLTLSRAPIVVFIAVHVAIFLYYNTKKRLKIIGKVLLGLLLAVLVLLMMGVDVQAIWNKISTLFLSLTSNSASAGVDFGDNYNPYIYRAALLNRVLEYMKENRISMLFGDYYWENSFSIDNGYLAFLIFNGVFGLIGRVLLYIFSIIESFKMFLKTRKTKNLNIIAFSYVIGVVLVGYMLNLFAVAQMGEATILLLIIGLVLSSVRINKLISRTKNANKI